MERIRYRFADRLVGLALTIGRAAVRVAVRADREHFRRELGVGR